MALTVDDLLDKVKMIGSMPTYQTAYNDTKLIKLLNAEITSMIVPTLVNSVAEHLVTYRDFTMSTTDKYVIIPKRAVGNVLREVHIVQGTELDDVINLSQISISDFGKGRHSNALSDYPAYYITRNRLYPTCYPNILGKLRLYYYQRPNTLVATDEVARITAFAYTTISDLPYFDALAPTRYIKLTVNAIPTVPAPWSGTGAIDIIQGASPYEQLVEDVIPAGLVGNDIFLDGLEMPPELSIGDFVSLTGYANVATVPEEIQDLLCQGVVMRVMESLGDDKAIKVASVRYSTLFLNATNLLGSRVRGEQRIINTSGGFV